MSPSSLAEDALIVPHGAAYIEVSGSLLFGAGELLEEALEDMSKLEPVQVGKGTLLADLGLTASIPFKLNPHLSFTLSGLSHHLSHFFHGVLTAFAHCCRFCFLTCPMYPSLTYLGWR